MSTFSALMAQELVAEPILGREEAGKSIWLEPTIHASLSWPGPAILSLYCRGYFPHFPAMLLSASLGFSASLQRGYPAQVSAMEGSGCAVGAASPATGDGHGMAPQWQLLSVAFHCC